MLQRQLASDVEVLDNIPAICEDDATSFESRESGAVEKVKGIPTNRPITAAQAEIIVTTMKHDEEWIVVQTSALGILAQVLEADPKHRELMRHFNVALCILAAMKRFVWKALLMCV